jgi:hypothetical protein
MTRHKHFWRVRHRAGTVILFYCDGCPELLPRHYPPRNQT